MSSIASVASAPSKTPRILACVLCQHRKIKCDRSFPCANCLKANVQCTPSTPAPARKRRRPNQDLQERLARCEELLKEYAAEGKSEATVDSAASPKAAPSGANSRAQGRLGTQSTPSATSTHSSQSTPPAASEQPAVPWQAHGKLIHEDGTVRFVGSYLLGTIYDELKAMREIIDDDECTPEDDTSDSMTPDTNADLLLGGETPSANTADLQPPPGQMFRLWQIFLDRVNPLTKVIHVPTLQPYLVEAASGSQTLPKNVEALLFSIYTLATVALTEEECQQMLNCTRESALQRFSCGVRISLIRIGFLKTHDLITLQALALYLVSLQGRYNRHAAWILNGIVIRIAQKMGLHRDGEALGLSPFETEMRRRTWWQIISVDAKYAILSGLGHSLLPRVWDAKEPKNINDADLHPSTTNPIQDREGPTEMIFSLLQNKISKFIVDSPGLEPMFLFGQVDPEKIPGGPTREQLREYRMMFEQLAKNLLDLLDRYCDPRAGPLHEFTVDFKAMIVEKLNDMLTPAVDTPEWGTETLTQRDHLFKVAVNAVEHQASNYNKAQSAGFLWFARLQFQVDLLIFTAGLLCQHPSGKLADRAWPDIEIIYSFHPELMNFSSRKEYLMLAAYLVKAWKAREDYHYQQIGCQIPTPLFLQQLQRAIPQDYLKEESPAAAPIPQQQYQQQHQLEHVDSKNDIKLDMEPTFDEFIGNYLDGGWDVFSNMNLAVPPVGNPISNSNSNSNSNSEVSINNHHAINHNSDPPNISPFGPFGLGPTTEW